MKYHIYVAGREPFSSKALRSLWFPFVVLRENKAGSNMSSGEKIPMNSREDDEGDKKDSGKVFVITRTKAIVLIVIVIALLIFVGVISGVFSARKARKDALAEKQEQEKVKREQTEQPTSSVSPTEPTGPEPWYKVRLPQNIRPIHYDFYLDPYLEQNIFKGNVSVLIKVTEKSDYMSYILIHIKDMTVNKAKVYKPAKPDTATPGDEVTIKKTWEYAKNDYFVFELEDDLDVGQYVIVMEYNSTFSIPLNGLYISTYTNEKGEKR